MVICKAVTSSLTQNQLFFEAASKSILKIFYEKIFHYKSC